MESEVITESIECILDEWDPIGVLQRFKPITYFKGAKGEYTNYVKPIISVYLSGESMYNYLVDLQSNLWDDPNDEMKEEITNVAKQIKDTLSKYDSVVLKMIIE